MTTEKKGKYETLAWVLIFVGLVFTAITTILFLINRSYSKDQPIDSAVFGQYGDIIGGLVGTVVALVSFLLLYETLNEQRRQFSKQQTDTQTALNEQRLQFKKQSEDEIFYRVLDKQQNRVINSSFNEVTITYSGYQIFTLLTDKLKDRLLDECHLLARHIICNDPENIGDLFLHKLFVAHDGKYDSSQMKAKKEKFVTELLKRDKNDRWEYIKYYFGSFGDEPPNMRRVLLDIGSVKFYKIDFQERHHLYQKVFSSLTHDYGFFLDGYLREIEFISRLVNKTINEKTYQSYFASHVTKYECIIIFYYLLSGQATKEFNTFISACGLFSDLPKYSSLIIDMPSDTEIKREIQNIEQLFET
ncbi:MAG: hypothetical protein ACQETL_00870 [Bacteroidota bacterium]